MDDLKVFEELGLSATEVKIYLALLELGESRAGEIITHTNLQNSVVHLTLGRLVDKGLASFVRHGKVRQYQATDPRNLLRWIDEKRHRVEELLPSLLARQVHKERQEAEVFEGLRGFKAMLYKLIEDYEKGDEYLFFAFYTPIEQRDREVYQFYREFLDERRRRGIKVRGIAHVSRRTLFEEIDYDMDAILFTDVPYIQNVSVFRNKIIITPWQYHPVAFLITSRQVADNFREYFNLLWSTYKPIG